MVEHVSSLHKALDSIPSIAIINNNIIIIINDNVREQNFSYKDILL